MPVQSNSADCNQNEREYSSPWWPHAVRATATFSSTAVIRRCENTRRVRPLTQDETSLQVLSDSWAPTATVSNDAFTSSCHLTLRRPFVGLCELNSAVQPYYALLCVIFTAMQWKSQFWFLKEPFSDHLKNKVLYWHRWFHWRV